MGQQESKKENSEINSEGVNMEKIKVMTQYAFSMLNVPYKWGGQTPLLGLDCSGFCIILLQSLGIIDLNEDTTAQGILEMAKLRNWKKFDGIIIPEGAFVFYGKEKCTHIMYSIGNNLTLGAQGGGSNVTGPNWREVSELFDARVKILPYNYRSDVLDIRSPF